MVSELMEPTNLANSLVNTVAGLGVVKMGTVWMIGMIGVKLMDFCAETILTVNGSILICIVKIMSLDLLQM